MPENAHFYCIFPVIKLFLNYPRLPFRPQNRGQKQGGTVPAFTLLSPRVTHEEKSRRRGARGKNDRLVFDFQIPQAGRKIKSPAA